MSVESLEDRWDRDHGQQGEGRKVREWDSIPAERQEVEYVVEETGETVADVTPDDDVAVAAVSEAVEVALVDESAVEAEVVAEAPVVDEPVVDEPVAEEPVVEAPVEEPVIDVVVDEPVVEEPVVEAPVVEEPVVEAPADAPVE
jgi:hypothetical protein